MKKYGPFKEHRPIPLVQMGLFLDRNGILLAFSLSKRNTNEQTTPTPLEQKSYPISIYPKLSFVRVQTLHRDQTEKLTTKIHAFIPPRFLKQLNTHLQKWALSTEG